MTSTQTILASLVFATIAAPALVHAKTSSDEQAIRQIVTRYETALNAADTATILDLYSRDGVQMAPDAPAAVGRDAVKAAYDGTFKAITLNLKFTVDDVKALGKTAALVRSRSAGTLKVNGVEQPAGPAAFKELFVLNKQADGQWKFTHYSFSTAPVAK